MFNGKEEGLPQSPRILPDRLMNRGLPGYPGSNHDRGGMPMDTRIRIPDEEFVARAGQVRTLMAERGIDLLLAYGNEAEPQFVRYLSDYWPSFETAGVLLGMSGDPILLIGPESATFAADRSRVSRILRIQSFRESSNPEYPGERLDSFGAAIAEAMGGRKAGRAAIAGTNIVSRLVFEDFRGALAKLGVVEVEDGDELVMRPRMRKSEAEIACMRKAGEISHEAMRYVIANVRSGMTELQVRGLACSKIYELGAENEAYPMWVLAGDGGDQAISRARHKVLTTGDLVHIGVGARYEGYASSIGRQVILGKPEAWMLDAIKAAYEAHGVVSEQLRAGGNARDVADAYYRVMGKNGYRDWLLYGPCHATGLMEGEPPWIEANSDYPLEENMTYCIDIFMAGRRRQGFRVEDSVRVGKAGADSLTDFPKEIFVA
ncbi:MAG: Xaa-Pro peptidase family protein [Spirochaetota bacterium]